jgi:hypothetical protein
LKKIYYECDWCSTSEYVPAEEGVPMYQYSSSLKYDGATGSFICKNCFIVSEESFNIRQAHLRWFPQLIRLLCWVRG